MHEHIAYLFDSIGDLETTAALRYRLPEKIALKGRDPSSAMVFEDALMRT